MATYKLIQDIEAEDHILGPLTLRQFIFALVAAFSYYLCFIVFVKHVYFLLALFLPPALFCTFFALPFGRDQPTEVWALAKLRFLFKPRRRIWDQSGVKELVTITVPKKVERVLTKGFSQNEVESRLKALASTLDSRGWAVKNVNLNAYTPPSPLATVGSDDRLIDIADAPQEVPSYDVQASDDILDETSNPVAQQFETMITQSSKTHRKQLMDELKGIRADRTVSKQGKAADYWFMGQPGPSDDVKQQGQQATVLDSAILPTEAAEATADENALATRLKSQNSSRQVSYSHMRTLRPVSTQPSTSSTAPSATPSATPADPAILSLANNNDLNVSTIARQAHKAKNGDEPPPGEVVISLH